MNISVLEEAARSVIYIEAPVSADLLLQRLSDACGINRKSEKMRTRMDYILKALKVPVSIREDSRFVFKDQKEIGQPLSFYRTLSDRLPADIASEEAARAAVEVTRAQFGMPLSSLIRETASALGFKTVSSPVKKLCEDAIEIALRSGELTFKDGIYKAARS